MDLLGAEETGSHVNILDTGKPILVTGLCHIVKDIEKHYQPLLTRHRGRKSSAPLLPVVH